MKRRWWRRSPSNPVVKPEVRYGDEQLRDQVDDVITTIATITPDPRAQVNQWRQTS